MSTREPLSPSAGESHLALTPEQQDAITAALKRILLSSSFRGSRRCCDFLEFVVLAALKGEAAFLKERNVAVAVFGRDESYDPSEDAVVRTAANEVRKRLAQYYQHDKPGLVRIELPPGGYAPVFHFEDEPSGAPHPAAAAGAAAAVRTKTFRSRPLQALAAATGVLAIGLAGYFIAVSEAPPESAVQAFWSPVGRTDKPVLICTMPGSFLRLPEKTAEALQALLPHRFTRGSYDLTLPPGFSFGPTVAYAVEENMAIVDALAAAYVAHCLGRMNRSFQIRNGTEISFSDVRNTPAVFVGAFNNRWSLETTKDLPMRFKDTDHVLDTGTGRKHYVRMEGSRVIEDYALITRVLNSRTGAFVVVVGGLRQWGTQLAGEFATREDQLQAAFRNAPANWRQHSLQILIRTEVVENTPGPAQIVDTRYW